MSGSTAILAYHPIARHLPRCDPVRSILAQMYQVFKPPAPSGGPVAPAQANRHSRAGGSPTGDRRFCPKSTPTAKSILIPPFDSPAHPCYRSFMTPAHSLSALSAYSAGTPSPMSQDVTVVARNVTSKSRQCLGHVTARQASPKLNVPKWHQVSRDAAMFYWAL